MDEVAQASEADGETGVGNRCAVAKALGGGGQTPLEQIPVRWNAGEVAEYTREMICAHAGVPRQACQSVIRGVLLVHASPGGVDAPRIPGELIVPVQPPVSDCERAR